VIIDPFSKQLYTSLGVRFAITSSDSPQWNYPTYNGCLIIRFSDSVESCRFRLRHSTRLNFQLRSQNGAPKSSNQTDISIGVASIEYFHLYRKTNININIDSKDIRALPPESSEDYSFHTVTNPPVPKKPLPHFFKHPHHAPQAPHHYPRIPKKGQRAVCWREAIDWTGRIWTIYPRMCFLD
jgi:hypothetical protein